MPNQRLKLSVSDVDRARDLLKDTIIEKINARCAELNQDDGKPTQEQRQALIMCLAAALEKNRQLSADLGANGLYQLVIDSLQDVPHEVQRKLLLADLLEVVTIDFLYHKRRELEQRLEVVLAA